MKRVHNEDEVTQKKNLMDVDEFTDQFDEATHSKCFLNIWTTYISHATFCYGFSSLLRRSPVARKNMLQKTLAKVCLVQ